MEPQLEKFMLSLENAMKNSVIKEIVKCEQDLRRQKFLEWIKCWPA